MTTFLALIVFLAAFAYDLCNARFLRAVAMNYPARAAGWSVLTYGIGLIGIISVIRVATWLVLPEAAGLYMGTYVGIRWRF